jgi:hypothetical protein
MTEREERDDSRHPLLIEKDDFSTGTWLEGRMAWHDGQEKPPAVDPSAIVKLPRNGPAAGQSVDAWLYGKNKNCQRQRDAVQWRKRPMEEAESENSGA